MPFQVGGVALHDDAQHSGSAKRNQASGVAGLNAAVKVPDASLEFPVADAAKMSAGHYVPDNTQNRAIAHGLGRVPKFIISWGQKGTAEEAIFCYQFISNKVWALETTVWESNLGTVTAWDSTNFYVGAAANGHYNNATAQTGDMYWAAFA